MPIKKKVIKKEAKPVEKILTDDDIQLKSIAEKRDSLIAEVKSNIISNGVLKRGGPSVRTKYNQEVSSWAPVIAEINELGAKLSIRPIGLGNIRG